MARIPESEIERLKNEILVERLVESSGVELKPSGKDLLGKCPFHVDDSPSLVVTPAKNLWHCFGCQCGGGPIDWVMKANGVSFRHAVELLRADPLLAADAAGAAKRSLVRKLPAPVALDAGDQQLLNQVIGFYHETLLQSPEALAYLDARGIGDRELIERFKLGFANRTLGLRLPGAHAKAGAEVRGRLQKVGVLRESGHEQFNGSLVAPVFDEAGDVTEVYGRKLRDDLRPGTAYHLYLPGPHRGVWNVQALQAAKEIILTEALIDAMTFWCAGYRNVTASYGVEGFTDDHLAAFKRYGTTRVLIAYDRDDAGERASEKLAEKLMVCGIECYRIEFPKGMDANEYALKVTPAQKSLGLLIRKAVWLGKGQAPGESPGQHVEDVEIATDVSREATALQAKQDAAPGGNASETPVDIDSQADVLAQTASASPLAASPVAALTPASASDVPAQVSDDEVVMSFGDRRYRVRGLAKNLSYETLKVNVLVSRGAAYYVDTFDLYSARSRSQYLLHAAKEIAVKDEIVKVDLGRVLMKLEALQDARIKQALQVEPATPEMSEAERDEALALLQSPALLVRILADFETCGIVGEATNKLTGYLAAVSRKLDHPLAVVIQSSSAAGKSSLMDAVLAFMPEEERIKYSAMTGQSLFYMGETNLKHKILAIVEEEGASRASYALKLLQSEGELTIASTGKDPATGNLVTQQYRVEGPVMIFLTTTAIEIDEELMNRCLVLSVDEGRAQTQAIHRLQRARRTLEGLRVRRERESLIQLHRNAQRLLRPLHVVNPYADALTFLSDKTRMRRDHEKYLTLIDAITLLHQYQRPIKTTSGGGGAPLDYIEATLDDIATANSIAHEVLGRSLDELPPQTRRLLGEIVAQVDARAKAQALRRSELYFSRKEMRDATGWSDTQLRVHLARLVEMEYLLTHREGAGGKFVYELVYDGQCDHEPHLSGLIDTTTMQKSRGSEAEVAGRSRPDSGPVAGRSRASEMPGEPISTLVSGHSSSRDAKKHVSKPAPAGSKPGGNGKDPSYAPVLLLAARARSA